MNDLGSCFVFIFGWVFVLIAWAFNVLFRKGPPPDPPQ